MITNLSQKLLDLNETSELLGVSPATVRNWVRHDYISPINPGRKMVFSHDSVLALKESIEKSSINRLSSRANKSKSKSNFVPLESLSSSSSAHRLDKILTHISCNGLSLDSSLFVLALKFLQENNLLNFNPSVDEVFSDSYVFSDDLRLTEELRSWLSDLKNFCFTRQYLSLYEFHLPNEEDILGLIYQCLINEGEKSQVGSYYTPREIISDIVSTYIQSAETDLKVLDPCCGTGRFLLVLADRFLHLKSSSYSEIYGVDTDPTAVRIARLNLLVKLGSDKNYRPNVYCRDTLLSGLPTLFDSGDDPLVSNDFDLIVTNPPWGAKYSRDYLDSLKMIYPAIDSGESFSYFICKSLKLLKVNGVFSFILPESIFNVKTHKDIRKLILSNTIEKIIHLDRVFKKVFTPVIRLDVRKNKYDINHLIHVSNGTSYEISQSRFLSNQDLSFDFHTTSYDEVIFSKIFDRDVVYLKGNADWALGIVTGDNKKHILSVKDAGYEEVYEGKDVLKFGFKKPSKFIKFDPDKLQQVAPEYKYRAPEKLIYRFISKELIFSYDTNKRLTLNSANVLIPKLENYPTKVILALFNSSLYQFIFQKKMASIKVLKSHLEQMPLPVLTQEIYDKIIEYVDILIDPRNNNGSTVSVYNDLDKFIMTVFDLSDNEVDYLVNNINSFNKSVLGE